MSTIDLRPFRPVPRRDGVAALIEHHIRSVARGVRQGVTLLLVWHERARQRRQLETLSDHMLRDIGLSRADVLAETTKPFWRP
ncbi:MAG TPA: DUF1127 domain-containing protein [Geminicoccaceae bacterium]|nr:DUF1127 domain-containing protein [Geminicoccaceae bacterium]